MRLWFFRWFAGVCVWIAKAVLVLIGAAVVALLILGVYSTVREVKEALRASDEARDARIERVLDGQ